MVVFNAHSNKVPLIVLYTLGNALLKISAYSGVLGNALIRKFLCDSRIVDQEIVVRFMLLQRKQRRSLDGEQNSVLRRCAATSGIGPARTHMGIPPLLQSPMGQ